MPVQSLATISTESLTGKTCVLVVGGDTYNYPQEMRTDGRFEFWLSHDPAMNRPRLIPTTTKLVVVVRQFVHSDLARLLRTNAAARRIPYFEVTFGQIKELFDRLCNSTALVSVAEPGKAKKPFSISLFVQNYYCQEEQVSARREGKRLARIAGRSTEAKWFIRAVRALRDKQIRDRFAANSATSAARTIVEMGAVESSELCPVVMPSTDHPVVVARTSNPTPTKPKVHPQIVGRDVGGFIGGHPLALDRQPAPTSGKVKKKPKPQRTRQRRRAKPQALKPQPAYRIPVLVVRGQGGFLVIPLV